MSAEPTTITITVSLFDGEHVRIAAGPDYIRLTHGTNMVDQVKAAALQDAFDAGVMTADEVDRKRTEHDEAQRRLNELAADVRAVSREPTP